MSRSEDISRSFYAQLGADGSPTGRGLTGTRRSFEGILNPHYRHDERSLRRICARAGVQRFQVFERTWAGRQRLFVHLDKLE